MSDEVWIALISALSGIITAGITAYIQLRVAAVNADLESKKLGVSFKKGKGRKPGRETKDESFDSTNSAETLRPKQKINWIFTGLIALVAGISMYLWIDRTQTPPSEEVIPEGSLSAALVEFQISIDNQQVLIPGGGTLEVAQGSMLTLDVKVTDATGSPYPHDLAFRYYFASGGNFSGKSLPYRVSSADTITVRIEDLLTSEAITRVIDIALRP